MDIRELLKMIIAKEASDLHLSVGLPPFMRTNGALAPLDERPLAHDEIEDMLVRILPHNRKMPLADEEADLGIEIKGIARFRINIYHDHNGLAATFRLIPFHLRSLRELGLPDVVGSIAEMKNGLVLVTGITGSGKTTTLAAIIDLINTTRREHIITIEDPIEYVHRNKNSIIHQREVGIHTKTFHGALRAALREDPNVILVGEMRDLETVSMAITAAETGHLVLATLHTRGAAQSVDRIVDIFPPYQQEQIRIQLADTLEMVVSQVLLPSAEGYQRTLACEVMVATTGIRQLIRARKTHQIGTEIETGGQYGMQTMEKSLKSLVNAGRISQASALAWTHDKKIFENS